MKGLTSLILLLCCAKYSVSYKILRAITSRSAPLYAAASAMIRKSKMKEVENLLKEIEDAGENHFINKFIKNSSIDEKIIGNLWRPVNFFSSTTNRFNSVTVMPEYSKIAKTGFILGLPVPEILGGILRDAGSKAIVVCLDKRSGGATSDEFARFVREQSRARILLPQPIPICWNDNIVHNIQIAHAGSLGASAVTLNPDFTDDLAGQISYSRKLNVEPIVMVKSFEEAQLALSGGATGLCLHTLEESQLIELRKKLPNDKGIHYMAR